MITPDALRALVLQLDPGDDEAEQKLRMALERRSARGIAEALRELHENIRTNAYALEDDMRIAEYVAANVHADQKTRDAITRAIINGSDLGVATAAEQLATIGFGVDWTLVNTAARVARPQQSTWLRDYRGFLYQRFQKYY